MRMISIDSYHRLEKIVRGFSNHRRIEILDLLHDYPGLSLLKISRKLDVNFKTCGEHVRRLAIASLVRKKAKGRTVRHTLTLLGENVLTFLRTLE